jgi:hypothetical protein
MNSGSNETGFYNFPSQKSTQYQWGGPAAKTVPGENWF